MGYDGGGAMVEAQGAVGPRQRRREAGISWRRGPLVELLVDVIDALLP